MNPFFITGLPRSRTAWLANWLTTDDSLCLHDGTLSSHSLEEYARKLLDAQQLRFMGDSNSGLGFIHEHVTALFPGCKWVVIERDRSMAFLSFRMAFGQYESEDESRRKFDRLAERLWQLKQRPGTMVIEFDDLEDLEVCRKLWFHCIPKVRFDEERWRLLNGLRVETFAQKHSQALAFARQNPWFSDLAQQSCTVPKT